MRLFRARREGRRLVRAIVKRLAKADASRLLEGRLFVKSVNQAPRDTVEIYIVRRRLRCLDSLYVRYRGCDIWLPLLSRLRLRRIVRCVLAEQTTEGLLG